MPQFKHLISVLFSIVSKLLVNELCKSLHSDFFFTLYTASQSFSIIVFFILIASVRPCARPLSRKERLE